MRRTVWLAADTLTYPRGGGHLWAYLNWALGLRAAGCDVVWLEAANPADGAAETRALVEGLRERLEPYGIDAVALCSRTGEPLAQEAANGWVGLEAASEADLLVNFAYDTCTESLARFRRTALVDIDPGLTQVWLSEGVAPLPPHDVYFTTGETVGTSGARFPSGGIAWEHTAPCVSLEWWPVRRAAQGAPFTTVSHWVEGDSWVTYGDESYANDKRAGFLPFLELPPQTDQPLELALCLEADDELRLPEHEERERAALEERGWRVVHAHGVAGTPEDYQKYIQVSKGEFSWAKPSCVRLQNAWVSDRTLCYLASGKPAVVEDTGPSELLPYAAGLFRFRTFEEAARCLGRVAEDYERQCRLARELAEEHFDARTVVERMLERALP